MNWVTCLVIFPILSCSPHSVVRSQITSIINVQNGGPWGNWGALEICPAGHVVGFSLKIEPYQGAGRDYDDTSLNGIRLICSSGTFISSSVGQWGAWSEIQFCPRLTKIVSFSLRVEGPQMRGDDTACNNIRFLCSDEKTILTGNSHEWGTFGPWSQRCLKYVCGIQTKVETPRETEDDTALNDVKLLCCS